VSYPFFGLAPCRFVVDAVVDDVDDGVVVVENNSPVIPFADADVIGVIVNDDDDDDEREGDDVKKGLLRSEEVRGVRGSPPGYNSYRENHTEIY
jgi:hypothetical protein